MRRAKRTRWIAAGVGVLVAASIVYGFLPKPQLVDVAVVEGGKLTVTLEEEGKARVRDRFVITAPTSGEVSRVTLEAGDKVEAGMTVAAIRPGRSPLQDPQTRAGTQAGLAAALDAKRQAEAAMGRSEALADGARTGFARAEKLAAAGAISRQQLDEARVELRAREEELAAARSAAEMAGHQVDSARAAAGVYEGKGGAGGVPVVSPIAGEVLRVLQESEAPVAAGTPLLELGDVRSLEIAADVLTVDAVRLSPGMPAELTRWGGEGDLPARVRRIEPSAFTFVSALGVQEQRVHVLLDLLAPPEQRAGLGDGFAVEVRFILYEAGDVLKVPRSALFRHEDGWAAFALRDGRARRVPVKVGQFGAAEVELLEGLEENATVIVHPGDTIADGARVEAREEG